MASCFKPFDYVVQVVFTGGIAKVLPRFIHAEEVCHTGLVDLQCLQEAWHDIGHFLACTYIVCVYVRVYVHVYIHMYVPLHE